METDRARIRTAVGIKVKNRDQEQGSRIGIKNRDQNQEPDKKENTGKEYGL